MPAFGARSREVLASCHPDLVRVMARAINIMDFSCIEGHRLREEHERLRAHDPPRTNVTYEQSKHSRNPSHAIGVIPYPLVNWDHLPPFYQLNGVIMACAFVEGVELRWGGDWDRDWDVLYNRWNDLPHYELWLP